MHTAMVVGCLPATGTDMTVGCPCTIRTTMILGGCWPVVGKPAVVDVCVAAMDKAMMVVDGPEGKQWWFEALGQQTDEGMMARGFAGK